MSFGGWVFIADGDRDYGYVNVKTGQAKWLGRFDRVLNDVEFHSNGRLYGVYDNDLYRIDPGSGKTSLVASFDVGGFSGMEIVGNEAYITTFDGYVVTYNFINGQKKFWALPDRAASDGDITIHEGKFYYTAQDKSIHVYDINLQHLLSVLEHGQVEVNGLISMGPNALYGFAYDQILRFDDDTGRIIDRQKIAGGQFDQLYGASEPIVIVPPVTPPDARDDLASTKAGKKVVIDVLANDSDPDGRLDPRSVALVDMPDHGTARVDAKTGKITYTPDRGFTGTDTFEYQVADNDGLTDTATVRVTVGGSGGGGGGGGKDEPVPPYIPGDGVRWNGTGRGESKTGTNASDILFGDAGNDVLRGWGGNDHLRGGDGNDEVYGDAGDDWLQGGFGNDRLYGGPGNDLLGGGENNDTLYGQGGLDSFVFREGHGRDTIMDAANGEKLFFPGLTLSDLSFSRDGRDLLIGHGYDGVRVKNFYGKNLSLLINGETWDADGGGGGGLDWTRTERADRKNGTNDDDRLDGRGGNDVLRGKGGDDVLIGGPGNDQLYGDAGTDTVVLSGNFADFRVQKKGKSWLVEDLDRSDGDEGTDRIYSSEILQFDDVRVDITGKTPQVLGSASSAMALDDLLTPADTVV